MGAIRGVLLVFVCVLFMITVFATGMVFSVSSSLKYDTLKAEALPLVNDFVEDMGLAEQLEEVSPMMEMYCQAFSDYTFDYEDFTIVFPCSVINQGNSAILSYGAEKAIDKIYYDEYDCKFWDCLGQSELPMFLVSAKAQSYWQGKILILLGVLAALAGLMFLLVEKKGNLGIIGGALVIAGAIPLLLLNKVLVMFTDSQIASVAGIFFSQSGEIFVRLVIVGGVLIVAGVVLRLFGVGFKISSMFSKAGSKKVDKVEKKVDKEPKEKKESKKSK